MFTGLIEEIGQLLQIQKSSSITRVSIAAKKVLEGTKIGDSIAVNGVCLTVCKLNSTGFEAELMPETSAKTQFATYTNRRTLNLERALRADSRIGGHIVSGHVDTAGVIEKISTQGQGKSQAYILQISVNSTGLIVPKGSIALDGVSLTVIAVNLSSSKTSFSVGIIPHTWENTILQTYKVGTKVNLEFDIQGKYQLASAKNTSQNLNLDQLKSWGY